MNPDELRELIKTAFRGVTLDGGFSIRQGEIQDNYGKDNRGREISEKEFASIPLGEITDDWSAIPLKELENYPYLSYLDAEGFRYYIPAFLLSLVGDPNRYTLRLISTLSAIYPKRDAWEYHMEKYKLLTEAQRSAIALFLFHFMDDPRLDPSDREDISRALDAYWHQYMPSK